MERGHDQSVLRFVGARRGVEAQTRALEGFPVTLFPGRGLARRLSVRSLVANAGAGAGFVIAVAMAVRCFAPWRPAVVVSFGGYASLPCVVAATLWRTPVVVVNVDAVPGAVNRLAARWAVASAVASEGVRLPRAVVTGVPVRAAMAGVERSPAERAKARRHLGLPRMPRSWPSPGVRSGSRRINRATLELARLWSGRHDVAIRHVVGRRDWETFAAAPLAPGPIVYQQVPYEEDMASSVRGRRCRRAAGRGQHGRRAGPGRVPSVLVPLPGAPGDHQGANARAMAAAGGRGGGGRRGARR